MPPMNPTDASLLPQLRSRLDQAISSESYEEAAGIRDEIRNIELGTTA